MALLLADNVWIQAQRLAESIQRTAYDGKELLIAIFLDRGIYYILSVFAALFLR